VLPLCKDLNFEATSSNGAETLFSQLQAMNGNFKPAAKDIMGVLGKVELIADARMQSDADRGYFFPVEHKATYAADTLGAFNSGTADRADSKARTDERVKLERDRDRITHARTAIRDMYRYGHKK